MRDYGITNVASYASAPAVGPVGDLYYNTTKQTLNVSDGAAWYVLDARQKRWNSYNAGEVTFAAATTLTSFTLPSTAPPGHYHVSFIAQFWTNQSITLLLRKNAVDFASAVVVNGSDYATQAIQSETTFAAGDVIAARASAPAAAGCRAGGNLFATWNGDY